MNSTFERKKKNHKKYCKIYLQKLTFRISRINQYVSITVQSDQKLYVAAVTGKTPLCLVVDFPYF